LRQTTLTDAYADIAEQKYPDDPEGRTYAQLIAEGQCKAAIKGKTDAAREIREALEGKTPQAFGDDTCQYGSLTLNIEAVWRRRISCASFVSTRASLA
jgi:hypothetical protein